MQPNIIRVFNQAPCPPASFQALFIPSRKESIRIHISSPHQLLQASHQIRGHGLQLLGVCRDVAIQHLK